MPDSLLPPGWGLAPFDDRDLDAVLAGKTADVPVALRPVADVLAALRAGPVPAELYGEADAMAEFRALGLGQAERPAGPAPTMLLVAPPARSQARPGRQPARHRARPGRPHPLRRAALRPSVLFAVAAAAVIVLAVVLTGNFAAPLRDIAHMASPSPRIPSAAGSTGHSSAPRVETTSAGLEPTGNPSVTHSASQAQSPASMCRSYYSYYKHPEGLSAWVAEQTLWQQLTKLAGSRSWIQVYRYCAQYVQDLFPYAAPAAGPGQAPQAPGHSGPGTQDNSSLGQQSGAAASGRTDSGSGTGSSSTGSDPAVGGQGDAPGSGSNP